MHRVFEKYPVVSGIFAGGVALASLYSVGQQLVAELPLIRAEFDGLQERER